MDGYLDAAATYLQANPLVGGAIGLVLLFLLIRKTNTFLFLLLLAAIVGGVLLLILDLAGCPRNLLTSAEHLRAWVVELIDAIKMKAYGEPIIEHFATHSFDAAGFTLLQLIETSNTEGR